jgi:chemotaxis protein methyltransferase CheR
MPGVSPDVYGEKDFKAVAQWSARKRASCCNRARRPGLFASGPAGARQQSGHLCRLYRDDPRNAEERRKAVCALTTNHTFFYREAHHFEHFTKIVRPHLVEMLDHNEAVRMWSAGSSSGEEVFSLTMALLGPNRDEGRRIATRDIRILASDIADHALEKASRAVTRSATPLACRRICAICGPARRRLIWKSARRRAVWSSSSG